MYHVDNRMNVSCGQPNECIMWTTE